MRNYFEIANQTGNMKLEANIEYRFPIVSIINGAVFVDAGNVWNIPREYEYDNGGVFHFNMLGQSIAVDYGIGIRADLSFILARIDAGFQLHNPIYTEDPWLLPIRKMFKEGLFAIHFGIDYPF